MRIFYVPSPVSNQNNGMWSSRSKCDIDSRRVSRGGSEGSGPTPAPAHGRFYTYVLNNMDVVITIIYSQKYVGYCLKLCISLKCAQKTAVCKN